MLRRQPTQYPAGGDLYPAWSEGFVRFSSFAAVWSADRLPEHIKRIQQLMAEGGVDCAKRSAPEENIEVLLR